MDPLYLPPYGPLQQVGRYLVPDIKEASFCAVFCPFSVNALVDVQGAVLDHPGGMPNSALLTLLFRQLLAPTEVLGLETRLEQGKLEVQIALSDRPFDGADDTKYPQCFEVEQLGLRAVVTFECGPVDLLAVTDATRRPALLPKDAGFDALLLDLPMRWLGLDDTDLRVATADLINGPAFLPLQSQDWITWFSTFGQVLLLDWTPIVSRDEADAAQDVRVMIQFGTWEAFHCCMHSLHDRFLLLREGTNIFHRVRLHLANRRLTEEEVQRARLYQLKREIEVRDRNQRLCLTALESAHRLEGGPQWLLPVVDFFRGWLNHQVIDASATNRAQGVEVGTEDDLVTSVSAWTRILKASETWCRAQHDVAEVDKSVVLKLLDRWGAEGIRICEELLTSEEELLLQWVFRRAAKALQKDLKEVQSSAEDEARRAEEELLGELQREAELEEQKTGKNRKKSKKKRDKKDSKKRADDGEDAEVASKDVESKEVETAINAPERVPTPVVAAPTPAGSRAQKGENKSGTDAQRAVRSRDAKKLSPEHSSDKKEEQKVPNAMGKERLTEVLEAVSKSEQLNRNRAASGDNGSPESTVPALSQEYSGGDSRTSRTSSQDITPGGMLSKKGFSHSRETTEAGSEQLFCDAVTDTASETHTSSDTHSLAPTGEVESSIASVAPGPGNDWTDNTAPTPTMPAVGCTLPTALLLAGAVHKGVLPPMPDGARSHTDLQQSNPDVISSTQRADAAKDSLLDSWFLQKLSDGTRCNWSDEIPFDSVSSEIPFDSTSSGILGTSGDNHKVGSGSSVSIDAQDPELQNLATHISSLFPAATVHIGPPEASSSQDPNEIETAPPASSSLPEVHRPEPLPRDAEPPSSPAKTELAKQILSVFPSAKVHIGPRGSPQTMGEAKSDVSKNPHGDHSQHDAQHPLQILFGSMPQASPDPQVESQPCRDEAHQPSMTIPIMPDGNENFAQLLLAEQLGPHQGAPHQPAALMELLGTQNFQNIKQLQSSSATEPFARTHPNEGPPIIEQWQRLQDQRLQCPQNQVRQQGMPWSQNEGPWTAAQMKGHKDQPLPFVPPWEAAQLEAAWKSSEQSWGTCQQQPCLESPRVQKQEQFQFPSPGSGASLRSQLREKGEKLLSQMDPERARKANRIPLDRHGASRKRQFHSQGMAGPNCEGNAQLAAMFASGMQPGMMGMSGMQPGMLDSMPSMSAGPFPAMDNAFPTLEGSFPAMEDWAMCTPSVGDQMMMVPAFGAPGNSGFSMPAGPMIQPASGTPGSLCNTSCEMSSCSTAALEAQLMAAQPASYED